MIRLTPYAVQHPVEVEPAEYEHLVQLKQPGWSVCRSRNEFLAKLHYLRQGRLAGKIEEAAFREKEKSLVLNWWKTNH